MLTIRFQRTGRKNDAAFRIIVSEKARSPKAGNPLQVLGSYNPKTKHTIIDGDSVKHWISKGASLSGTVNNLLISNGIIQGKKVNVLGKKNVPKKNDPSTASTNSQQASSGQEDAKAPAPETAPEEETKADAEEAKAE